MGIEIHIGDALEPTRLERMNGDGRVVVEAEPAGFVGQAMVRTARRADGTESPPLPHCPARVPGHLRRTRRIVMHEWIRMNIARQAPLAGLR